MWALAWGACVFALWLNANPYIGIDHDARLYSLMAYRWLSPAAFAHDPWFMFGSQDDFSVFSPLLAGVFSLFGVACGAMVATLIQGMGFSAAVIFLTRTSLDRKGYALAALLAVSFPVLYSPNNMLNVTEGFVSARGFAVPLALAGLAWCVRGRAAWAAIFFAASFVLHPIMAATPLAVGALMLTPGRLRPWLLLSGWTGYVLLLLGALHGHLPLIEGEWRNFVGPAPLVFIDNWIGESLAPLGFWAVLLLIASRHGAAPIRLMYGLVPIVAASGVAFSMMATFVPWVTAVQAQFWRGLWLMKLVALIAVADLLWQFVLSAEAKTRRMMSIGTALILVLGFDRPVAAAIVLVALFQLARHGVVEAWLSQRPRVFLGILMLLLALAVPGLLFELAARVGDAYVQGFESEVLRGLWRNAGLGVFALGFCWCVRQWSLRALSIVAAVMFLVAVFHWDGRNDARRLQESRYAVDGRFSAFTPEIPRGATVSWNLAIERVWFELATADYAGVRHATGMVFSERRTLLLAERFSRVVLATLPESPPLGMSIDAIRSMAFGIATKLPLVDGRTLSTYEYAGPPTAAGIDWLCQDPALDFVIDHVKRADRIKSVRDISGTDWYLYRCDLIRKNLKNAS